MRPTPLSRARNDGGDDADEHERRADHRVQEELRGRVDPVLVAPAADEEVHRHEHDLEEDEEHEQVEAEEACPSRRPRAAASRRGRACRRGAGRRRAIDEREQHAGEHDEEQRDAVDAEVPGDPPRLDPRVLATRTGSRPRRSRTTASSQTLSAPVTTLASSATSLIQLRRRRFDEQRRASAPTAGTSDQRGEDRERRGDRVHQRIPRTTTNQASSEHDADADARRRSCARSRSAPCAADRPTPRTTPAGAVDRTVDDVGVEPGDALEAPRGPGPPMNVADGAGRSTSPRRGSPARSALTALALVDQPGGDDADDRDRRRRSPSSSVLVVVGPGAARCRPRRPRRPARASARGAG